MRASVKSPKTLISFYPIHRNCSPIFCVMQVGHFGLEPQPAHERKRGQYQQDGQNQSRNASPEKDCCGDEMDECNSRTPVLHDSISR
ncbi:MAG: hypothetical protein JWO95_1847 [Verrucomicrobiales bacterium]|nr:hypothetical protein [Verrucomicrobiales bacterium]